MTCSVAVNPCPEANQVLMASDISELIISGGFHVDSFEVGFAGLLGCWVVGFSIGLVIAQVRKLRGV
jgi:hypothetical protein